MYILSYSVEKGIKNQELAKCVENEHGIKGNNKFFQWEYLRMKTSIHLGFGALC